MSATLRTLTPVYVAEIPSHGRFAARPRWWIGAAERAVRAADACARAVKAAGARPYVRAGATGLAGGAAVAGVSGAVVLRNVGRVSTNLPADAQDIAREYTTSLVGEGMLFCVAVGIVVGLAARWSARDGGARRTVAALVGLWAGLVGACIYFSPTSLPDTPILSAMPFAAPLTAVAVVALLGGYVGRVRWTRYAAAHAALALPLLVPDPTAGSLGIAAASPAAGRSVVLLGLDNVGRDGMRQLAARIASRAAASAPRRGGGVRLFDGAVSPVPLTRLAWSGVLLGRDPGALFALDTLGRADRDRFFAAQPFVLTREAARAGYVTSYTTDDATTNAFAPGELFDVVHADAVGWQVVATQTVSSAFPLAAGYVWRWRGVGVANTPGAGGTWRVFRAVARQLAAPDGRPQLVAAHAVSLHGAIRPSAAELGGLPALALQSPTNLEPEDPTAPARAPVAGAARRRRTAASQVALYARRRAAVLHDTEEFVAQLTEAGYRERSLIVIFTDHGELFAGDSSRNLAGMHGTELEPTSLEVGVIVLLPTADAAAHPTAPPGPDGLTVVSGLFPLHDLGMLVNEFVQGVPGGRLAAARRGDSLPSRIVPVRSGGRLAMGDTALTRGRKTLATASANALLRLWPDGRVTLTGAGAGALAESADFGWTDGRWLVSYAPLAGGGYEGRCYDGPRAVAEWRAPALPAAPEPATAAGHFGGRAAPELPTSCGPAARAASRAGVTAPARRAPTGDA